MLTEPITDLADIDRHFADFVCRLGGSGDPVLWRAAALASNATGRGNICLDLSLLGAEAEDWAERLHAFPVVGRPGEVAPLVLDQSGRLYLHRYWEYESRLAENILSLAAAGTGIDVELLQDGLRRLFPQAAEREPDWQRIAALTAVCRKFAVISGGPGTGKTSTVVKILVLLLEQAKGEKCRILLAAPTGKAAARLAESIRAAKGRLDSPPEVLLRIPEEVSTIHRLLGYNPRTATFRHNRGNPLPCRVIVVDEASMVDLPLMAKLVDAMPTDARLLLLGDKDQLASVEAGAVLGDICDTGHVHSFSVPFRDFVERTGGEALPPGREGEAASLCDSVVVLTRSYRFDGDSGIGELSRLINEGRGKEALALLKGGMHAELGWRDLPPPAEMESQLRARVVAGYGTYLAAKEPAQVLDAFNSFRILCALRKGPYGMEGLNAQAEKALCLRGRDVELWYAGRPVMVTGNDYALRLFNGDTGVVLSDPTGGERLHAYFPDPSGGVRKLHPLRLPGHETVFAMTVHKSQGSEFDRLLLILPDRPLEVVTRELIYTAITRARKGVEIWGRDEAFLDAVARRVQRRSGLRDILWGGKMSRLERVD